MNCEAVAQYCVFPLDSLRIGLQLPFDVYEDHGEVLLLKRGSVITPKQHLNLRLRESKQVFVSVADLDRARKGANESRIIEQPIAFAA